MNDATAFDDHRAAQKRKKELGQKGKDSEAAVKRWLSAKVVQIGLRFAWDRPVDTREAGGTVKATVGDFDLMYNGRLLTLEVKETEIDNVLPRKNFKRDQIARLKRRSLAGVPIVVLVHHTTAKLWTVSGIDPYFECQKGDYTAPKAAYRTCDAALDAATRSLFQ